MLKALILPQHRQENGQNLSFVIADMTINFAMISPYTISLLHF
jgi:hypothetical protein